MVKRKDRIVLKYLGQHDEQWSCVPARDLTEMDIAYIEEVIRGPSTEDIVRVAETMDGKPLYVRVESVPKEEVEEV